MTEGSRKTRRNSLFRQKEGGGRGDNREREEVKSYMSLLEDVRKESFLERDCLDYSENVEKRIQALSLPNLDDYIQTVTEFHQKCDQLVKKREFIKEYMKEMTEKLIGK